MGKGHHKRRTRWLTVVAIEETVFGLGATNKTLLTETEMEDELAGGTITRVVGSIYGSSSSAGGHVMVGGVWVAPNYVGATLPVAAEWFKPDGDIYDRPGMMTTFMAEVSGNDGCCGSVKFDLRSQRKIVQGSSLQLTVVNTNAAATILFSMLIRVLVKLP